MPIVLWKLGQRETADVLCGPGRHRGDVLAVVSAACSRRQLAFLTVYVVLWLAVTGITALGLPLPPQALEDFPRSADRREPGAGLAHHANEGPARHP